MNLPHFPQLPMHIPEYQYKIDLNGASRYDSGAAVALSLSSIRLLGLKYRPHGLARQGKPEAWCDGRSRMIGLIGEKASNCSFLLHEKLQRSVDTKPVKAHHPFRPWIPSFLQAAPNAFTSHTTIRFHRSILCSSSESRSIGSWCCCCSSSSERHEGKRGGNFFPKF